LSTGATAEQDAFVCDRELVLESGLWHVRSLA
jgi:hypothetical protein